MKQEILDFIAGSIAIITTSSSFLFWLASRQIKDQLFHKIDKISDNLNKKLENELIKTGFRLQRWQDINKLKTLTLESRLETIEHQLKIDDNGILQTINDGFSNTDSTDF